MTDLLIVSGEALWPAVHGGRIRAAGMAEALAGRFSVRVAAPVEGGVPTGVDIGVDALPDEEPVPRLVAVASPQPRLGRALLGPRRSRALLQAVADHRPRAVLFVNGYLAAAAPSIDRPTVVDFHDVEVRRGRSLAAAGSGGRRRARAAAALESVKAQWWEPVEARRSAAVSATTADDVALLASWGARAVLVGHGSSASPLPASPGDGPVTLLAGLGYGPNRAAARWVLDEVWPRLRAGAGPGLRLRIVGRGAEAAVRTVAPEGVEVVGDPDDVEPFYRKASVVLAPVTAGGGAQVKVTEALARARV
ncbi:MAG: hypothetical protein QOI56_347, partial [Actinomycetota bacterium]|nr:hypothetical protein [Actinomycetota bacterium]